MNRRLIGTLILGCVFVLYAGIARAQQTPPPPQPHGAMMMQAPPEGDFLPPPFGERMELLGFAGMHGGKVVTNAPFCATATTTQMLADGKTNITRTSLLCRDPQGRVSREMTLPGESHPVVLISDPVAHKHYLLRPDQRVAYVYEMPSRGMKGGPKGLGKGGPGNRQWKGNAEANVQKLSLGTQPINGVSAEGMQYTRTILPGQIGNDQPIVIVSKQWYSPEFQTVIMRTHSDPWSGTVTYNLIGIQGQADPAKFTVTPDYTVKQGGPRGMRRFRGGPPADAPARPPSSN